MAKVYLIYFCDEPWTFRMSLESAHNAAALNERKTGHPIPDWINGGKTDTLELYRIVEADDGRDE